MYKLANGMSSTIRSERENFEIQKVLLFSRAVLKPRQNRELSIELTKQFVSFGDFK